MHYKACIMHYQGISIRNNFCVMFVMYAMDITRYSNTFSNKSIQGSNKIFKNPLNAY